MSSSANSPLQKGVEAVNGDRIIEDTETRQNVEPVFGQMKFNLGFRRFVVRGLDEGGGEFDGLTRELQAIYYLLKEGGYPSSPGMATEWKN